MSYFNRQLLSGTTAAGPSASRWVAASNGAPYVAYSDDDGVTWTASTGPFSNIVWSVLLLK